MQRTRRRAPLLSLLVAVAIVRAAHAQTTAAAAAPPPLQAVGPQAGFGDLLVLGSTGHLQLLPAAAPAGPVTLDGAEVTAAALAGPFSPGAHAVSVQAAAAAPTAPPAALRFVYDPAPPQVQWELGDTRLLDHHGLDQNEHRQDPPRRTDPSRDHHVAMLWSPDGRRWLPVLAKDAKADADGALADWLVAADKPQVFLWALEDGVLGSAAPVAPRKLQIVRVWGTDELSAVRDLHLRVLPDTAAEAYRLEIVATDLVGNQTKVTWPLVRR